MTALPVAHKTKMMSKSIAKSCAISDIRKEYFEINKCTWRNMYYSTLNAFATDEEYKRMNKEIIRIKLDTAGLLEITSTKVS